MPRRKKSRERSVIMVDWRASGSREIHPGLHSSSTKIRKTLRTQCVLSMERAWEIWFPLLTALRRLFLVCAECVSRWLRRWTGIVSPSRETGVRCSIVFHMSIPGVCSKCVQKSHVVCENICSLKCTGCWTWYELLVAVLLKLLSEYLWNLFLLSKTLVFLSLLFWLLDNLRTGHLADTDYVDIM